MGMQSYGYSYDANVYLTSVTKPSGTTGFHIEPSLPNLQYRITVTDPLGFSEEYLYTGMLSGTYRDKNQYLQSWVATTYSYALVSGQGVVSQIAYPGGKYLTYSNYNAARQPQTQVRRRASRQADTRGHWHRLHKPWLSLRAGSCGTSPPE